MTDDQIAIARRAIACKGWRWMPGMAWFDERYLQYRVQSEAHAVVIYEDRLPDLTDPATLGCLLAMVREAWKAPSTVVVPLSGNRWGVAIPSVLRESPRHKGNTEAEALVAALEAAP